MSKKLTNREKFEIRKEKRRREKQAAYKEDFQSFSEDHIKIITKDATQGFIPFKFNDAQLKINEQLEKQRKETGRVRAIILKARQQGISTYCAGRVFWKTYYTPHTRSVVMAHDAPTSDNLFNMSKNLIARMDDDMRPTYAKSNAKELIFDHNEAGYRLYTAGNPEAGRGTTPTIAHLSEVAFWQHDEKILAGLFQGISQSAGTEVILESTANGAAGEFHRLWQKAVEGENEYLPIFIPWFITSEYRRDLPEGGITLAPDEERLKEEYDLDDEQIYWRRLKIAESGARKFQQEYPAEPEEAFLVSGSNVFDPRITNDMESKAPVSVRKWDPFMGSFDENREGALQIWVPPTHDKKFVIGADVSLGANQDFSVATVFDVHNRLCAMYRTNTVDPGTFGDILFYLGRYFNNALVCVESNSIGNTTLDRLRNMNYVNLYYETKVAMMRTEETEKLGFRTTSASKPRIIGHLKRAVEDMDIQIPSDICINELKNYVQLDNGKTEATPGKHDDCIMAMAISLEVLRTHGDRLMTDRVSWEDRIGQYKEDNTLWL